MPSGARNSITTLQASRKGRQSRKKKTTPLVIATLGVMIAVGDKLQLTRLILSEDDPTMILASERPATSIVLR
jgi:hypothetical protein